MIPLAHCTHIALAAIGSLSNGEFAGCLAATAVAASLVAWWIHRGKAAQLRKAAADAETAWREKLRAQEEDAARLKDQAESALQKAAQKHNDLEERFTKHRETAQIREQRADERIAALEADLRAAREVAAQLEPTKARIGDLETAINAERGRVAALEKAVQVSTARADDLERRLKEAQDLAMQWKDKTHQRELELAEKDKSVAGELERLGNADTEMQKLRDHHTAYQQQAEARIANLQRQLAAAEAKSAMVQKEFMSAVGVLPEPSSAATTPGKDSDRRVRELEDKLTQAEAEARKKAREDGYKIAELEYRLTEAQETAARLKELEPKAAEADQLRPQVEALKLQCGAAKAEIETLTAARDQAVAEAAAGAEAAEQRIQQLRAEIGQLRSDKEAALSALTAMAQPAAAPPAPGTGTEPEVA